MSKNIDVARKQARKAIEKLYDSTCTIVGQIKYKKTNGATGFKEGIKAENIKCSISKKDNQLLNNTESTTNLRYSVTMFCSPDEKIVSGDEIEVKFSKGHKRKYIAYEPFQYTSHLEVPLVRKDRV